MGIIVRALVQTTCEVIAPMKGENELRLLQAFPCEVDGRWLLEPTKGECALSAALLLVRSGHPAMRSAIPLEWETVKHVNEPT